MECGDARDEGTARGGVAAFGLGLGEDHPRAEDTSPCQADISPKSWLTEAGLALPAAVPELLRIPKDPAGLDHQAIRVEDQVQGVGRFPETDAENRRVRVP